MSKQKALRVLPSAENAAGKISWLWCKHFSKQTSTKIFCSITLSLSACLCFHYLFFIKRRIQNLKLIYFTIPLFPTTLIRFYVILKINFLSFFIYTLCKVLSKHSYILCIQGLFIIPYYNTRIKYTIFCFPVLRYVQLRIMQRITSGTS